MTPSFINNLICPACKHSSMELSNNLISVQEHKNEIISGTISCVRCNENFPIMLGIPVLINNPKDYCSLHKNEILIELNKFDNFTKESIEFINKNSAYSIYGNMV